MTKAKMLVKYKQKLVEAVRKSNDVSLHLVHRLRWEQLQGIYREIVSDLSTTRNNGTT